MAGTTSAPYFALLPGRRDESEARYFGRTASAVAWMKA